VLAVDAPCFGQSSGPTGQANLWRGDDAALLLRLLEAFGVGATSGRATCLAQCMGAGMFMRALALSPGHFGPNHVLSNATIGTWPESIPQILSEKGGMFWGYHQADPDHMRVAVAYRELTALATEHPTHCKFVDQEWERARAEADGRPADLLPASMMPVAHLSRGPTAYAYNPDPRCIGRIVTFLQRPAGPRGILAPPMPDVLPTQSAVERGVHNAAFKVFVRSRPPLPREGGLPRAFRIAPFATVGGVRGQEVLLQDSAAGRHETAKAQETRSRRPPERRRFVFEDVFPEDASQDRVFEVAVLPVLDTALDDGVDSTVFAYGQTGSGKTHTVDGVVPRAVRHLHARKPPGTTLSATYVELYNGVLRDLFHCRGDRVCTLNKASGGGDRWLLGGATTVATAAEDGLMERYREAAGRRATLGTAMNLRSSRSHTVLSVTVHDPGRRCSATVHLVDLAGSERLKRSGSTGAALEQAISINGSLLALQRVVHTLVSATDRRAPKHVPYRESPLTKLLANAIGGKARTVLIACVSPTVDSCDETTSTLRFATCASLVRNKVDAEAEAARKRPAAPEALSDSERAALTATAATFGAATFAGGSTMVPMRKGQEAVEVYGDFSAGPDAPVCVLLHYYGHGSEGGAEFTPWFAAIREAGYRCLAPSFPGHGGSPGSMPSRPDPQILAGAPCAVLTAVLDHFGVGKCVIYGYDWGGGVGLEMAIGRRKRVRAVVACCASYRDEDRLRLLKQRGFKTRHLAFLGTKGSQVHLWNKTQKQAKAAGVEPRLATTMVERRDFLVGFLVRVARTRAAKAASAVAKA